MILISCAATKGVCPFESAPKELPRPNGVTMTSADQGKFLMGNRNKGAIGRRQLLRTGLIGIVAASAASALEIGPVAADTGTSIGKTKARFRANAAEVQEFYRVNRYPKR
jgi:hypothetical protein